MKAQVCRTVLDNETCNSAGSSISTGNPYDSQQTHPKLARTATHHGGPQLRQLGWPRDEIVLVVLVVVACILGTSFFLALACTQPSVTSRWVSSTADGASLERTELVALASVYLHNAMQIKVRNKFSADGTDVSGRNHRSTCLPNIITTHPPIVVGCIVRYVSY